MILNHRPFLLFTGEYLLSASLIIAVICWDVALTTDLSEVASYFASTQKMAIIRMAITSDVRIVFV